MLARRAFEQDIARKGLLRSFQVCRLFGNLTVRENLLLPYLARGRAGIADGLTRAETFLKLTRLAPLAELPARGLSGGQRALLQVACGFMVPDLLCYVLDEPFAGINPVIKDAIIELILEENRAHGTTFLIVSHEMSVMRRLCRKITVMIEGRILAEGPSNTPLPISFSRRKPGPIWPQLAVGFMDPGLRREGGAK